MIYGTDSMNSPAAYQELKDFLELAPKDKLRVHHGVGSPVEVLNGIMAGMDIFESDYPFTLAEQGISILINDINIDKSLTD